jgi:H+-transporting ATPase
MLMLITLLNDGTMIAVGYDNVEPRAMPGIYLSNSLSISLSTYLSNSLSISLEKWNLKIIFLISTVMAVVAFTSSLLVLFLGLGVYLSIYLSKYLNIYLINI